VAVVVANVVLDLFEYCFPAAYYFVYFFCFALHLLGFKKF